jgi:hypothetical protein
MINNNIYQVKVRATLTTEKGLLNPESIETADKIITVTVEGINIIIIFGFINRVIKSRGFKS